MKFIDKKSKGYANGYVEFTVVVNDKVNESYLKAFGIKTIKAKKDGMPEGWLEQVLKQKNEQ